MNAPPPLFEQVTRLDRLEAAWERVRENQGGAGGDGVGLVEFEVDLPTRLVRLQLCMRAGTYRPGPVRRVDIPKDDGDTRLLCIPSVVDRVAQTAVAMVLTPLLDGEMADASFAYRPGRSVQMAVERVAAHRRAGYGWVVDGDIERFFDRVPHERLLARLERSVEDRQVLDLVALWLDAIGMAGGMPGLGLPQGSPLSPLLANLYLDDIDDQIQGRGVRLVRFADDFLLMCREEAAAAKAQARMARLLADHGLRLHPEKTRVVPFEQGFRFLGHLFVRSLVVREVADEDAALPPADAARILATHAAIAPADAPDLSGTDEGGDRAPTLRVLYITEPGRRLDIRNEAFTVTEPGPGADRVEVIAIPPQRLDRVELSPDTDASAAALRHALAHGVAVDFVNGWGDAIGHLAPAVGTARAGLHMAQARLALDPLARLDLARRLVDGRLRNQRALLSRLNRRRKDAAVVDAGAAITRAIRKLPIAADVPALMGMEGAATAAYWPALGKCLEKGWSFSRRRRQPPPDPVNLILSFLSGLLYRDITALCARAGLHPGFGSLHSARDNSPALASDLVEEFRAPLVEGLAVYLFNNRILDRAMFSRRDGACHLSPDGRKAVIRAWEGWLDRPVLAPDGRRVLWRRLIAQQISAYAAHARGDSVYTPYRMDY
ncbi:CRISPR-associated endonuclease Cas1 [Niveispirillum sp.]|uniref:CRISPR-associated endonuclease Cas1 n=1 Tax=Niveispirillum sp. TaxID=1917217 RepID=UPI001B7C6F1C|nr:CRISPR-associated endonuclease Cas1 [Niveispirillum sp.]MBP7339266.1 CRISPR-associated endonuclease Cas1 [Niveispirillum sp.]